ncbi:MFS transporter [Microbispora sp. ATCC PTA-5024]|uniref:MFS transporter n=1 Tax=Microbispora sp. ATCC PTA-5024 TaxID=316330 RepID=UPI0003DB8702|nr:MFS transporter [Microbispora sp. ATCC PTA-5024]ETK37754.1 hypothetical protein MPTA5024_02140 [Microbispora sp. ATCC PTA-5024]
MTEKMRASTAICLVGARSLSTLGSMASALAILVWVRDLTGSNGAAALSMLVFALPTLAFPLLGQLVDSFNRLALLVISQLIGIVLVSSALLVHDASDVWLIYVIQLLQGVNSGLVMISSDSLLPQVAAKSQLSSMNGFLQTAGQIARVIAPTLGALVFARFGGIRWVVALDVSSFVASILLLLPLRSYGVGRPEGGGVKEGYLASVREGVGILGRQSHIRMLVIAGSACVLTVGLLSSIVYAVIIDGLHQPASFAGVLATAQAAGGVAGGLLGSVLARSPARARTGARGSIGLMAIGALSFVSGSSVLVAGGMAVFGIGGTLLVVLYVTGLQSEIPENVLGRAFAGVDALVNLAQVGGITLGTLWLATFPSAFQPVIAAAVAVLLVCLVLMALGRSAAGVTSDETEPLAVADLSGETA